MSLPDIASLKGELVDLIRERSYREGDFTLASGKKSTFYIDMKATTLSARGAWLIGRLSAQVIAAYARQNNLRIGGVGGLTLGADPIATAVSMCSLEAGFDWPAYIVRKEAKDHGTGRYVEGKENLAAGASLVVLEDVVTTGGSSVKAIERLRGEGFRPAVVLTVVDRLAGGEAAFRAVGVDLIALVTIDDLKTRSQAI